MTSPEVQTVFPGKNATCKMTQQISYIFLDSNGVLEEPNQLGKDRFILPVSETGVWWDAPCE